MIKAVNMSKSFKVRKRYEGFSGAIKTLFSNEYEVKTAIDDLNFEIEKGDIVGYIGLNGAGKSTTIKILTGLMTPTSGYCEIDGVVPYKDKKNFVKDIGVVFGQRTQLWWDLPVSESFSILKKIYEIPDDVYKKNLAFLSEILDIKSFYLTPVRNLSLGQKMRADLAAALLHQPKIVFLDEPTIGLDIVVKDKLRKAIKQINAELNTTVILTTHDIDDIQETCNKVIMIDKGKIQYDGSINNLISKYNTYRSIKFDLLDPLQSNIDLGIFNAHKPQSIITEINDNELIVKYLNDNVNASEIISSIVNQVKVKDISMQETKLEDILMNIYA